jgi:DNA-binding transcriptional LysR family regulator
MTPKQVRSVITVVETGSVNRAAETLHLAPSSVSAQIKELSSELGVELFEPVGRRIVLSAGGQDLLPSFYKFQNLVTDISQRAHSIANEPIGVLKLFAPSSMCIYRLPPLIEALQSIAPQIEVILTHEPYDFQHGMSRGEIDAAILVTEVPPADWQYHEIASEKVVYVCNPKLHKAGSLPLDFLMDQAVITTEPGCTYRSKAEAHFKSQGLQFKPRQSFANVEVVRRCLLANMGIGLLPQCVVEDDLEDGNLVQLDIEGAPYQFFSALVYPKERKRSPKLKALLEAIEQA